MNINVLRKFNYTKLVNVCDNIQNVYNNVAIHQKC